MQRNNRRNFLKNSGFLLAGTAIVNNNLFAGSERMAREKEEEVSPNEDLMREQVFLNAFS